MMIADHLDMAGLSLKKGFQAAFLGENTGASLSTRSGGFGSGGGDRRPRAAGAGVAGGCGLCFGCQ